MKKEVDLLRGDFPIAHLAADEEVNLTSGRIESPFHPIRLLDTAARIAFGCLSAQKCAISGSNGMRFEMAPPLARHLRHFTKIFSAILLRWMRECELQIGVSL
jgi:hypothetical protein